MCHYGIHIMFWKAGSMVYYSAYNSVHACGCFAWHMFEQNNPWQIQQLADSVVTANEGLHRAKTCILQCHDQFMQCFDDRTSICMR